MHKPATWHDYVASRLLDEHIQPGIHAHLEVAVRIPGVVQPLDLAHHLAEEQAQTYTRLDVIGVCCTSIDANPGNGLSSANFLIGFLKSLSNMSPPRTLGHARGYHMASEWVW